MEKSEKPIKEWLKELPEPIRELGIKRMQESCYKRSKRIEDSLEHALLFGFDWEQSSDGVLFWDKWHDYICDNTDENGVFTDPKDYSGLPMPDGFSLQNEPPEYANHHRVVVSQDRFNWIPITENTPANNQKVLVCWSHTPVWEPSQAYYVGGQFYPERGASPYFRVTHWMEMPKGVTE